MQSCLKEKCEFNNYRKAITSKAQASFFNKHVFEKVKLISVDNKTSICKIETSKIVEGEILTKSVMDFLKRNNKDKTNTMK